MSSLIRSLNWSATSVGAIEDWPVAVYNTVNLLLNSPFPTALFVGPEQAIIYNDAYRPFTSDKHPQCLGQPGASVWGEAWHIIGPLYEAALTRGEASLEQNFLVPLLKDGRMQDFYWMNSISPVYDATSSDETRGDESYAAARIEARIIGVYNVCHDMTEAVLGQRRLRESELRSSRILQSIADAVIVTDAAGCVTRMNPVAESMTGWAFSEARGRALKDVFYIVDELSRKVLPSPFDIHLKRAAPAELHGYTLLIARNGSGCCIEEIGAVVRDERDELAGIVIVFRSIEERRAMERQRDRLSGRLEQVMSVITYGVLSIDRSWRVTYLNPKAEQLLAGSQEILGSNLWQLWPQTASESSPYTEQYHLAMYDQIPGDFEAFYASPLKRWFRIQVRPAEDGIVIFFRDVTEEKSAADALRAATVALSESEEELRWTVALSAQTPWIADPDGRILDFSEQWLELTGLTREQALGDGWTKASHPIDLPNVARAWQLSIATGEAYDAEYRVRMASGEYRWMRSRAFARFGSEGEVVRWYGSTEDIHDRKRSVEALIQNEKLAAVGRMAASISHEINNPLESIGNLLYLAQSSPELTEIHEYLDLAERELRRVSAISSQTLRFHRQSTSPTTVTSEDLLGGVLTIFQGRIHDSHVEVERRDRSTRRVNCYEGEIRQVLSNLIGNAIDALHGPGGRLLLRSRDATDWTTGRTGLMLTVADTGGGMSPGVRKRIFEAFFTTKGLGGTGLGLWISQEILARHKGRLRVRSRQLQTAHGTVFALFLPLDAAPRPEADFPAADFSVEPRS